MYGGTFNGHPLAVAAALATIERLAANDGAAYRHLYRLGDRMRDGLIEITSRLGINAQPTSLGSVFVCYFTDKPVKSYDDAISSNGSL